jgi:hypothetical protein
MFSLSLNKAIRICAVKIIFYYRHPLKPPPTHIQRFNLLIWKISHCIISTIGRRQQQRSNNLPLPSTITLFASGYVDAINWIDFCTRKRRCSHILQHSFVIITMIWMERLETICFSTHPSSSSTRERLQSGLQQFFYMRWWLLIWVYVKRERERESTYRWLGEISINY